MSHVCDKALRRQLWRARSIFVTVHKATALLANVKTQFPFRWHQQIRIASPCSANWERMAGDDRVRYCPECQLNVYNMSALTISQIEELVANHEGRLCGRFYRRLAGT